MKKALLVIDPQNDYFPGYKFPLWNTSETLQNILTVISHCVSHDIPIIMIQHIADESNGIAPFFNEGSIGVEIHPEIMKAAPQARIVKKSFADGFVKTTLEQELSEAGVEELLVCGMMTQNCVTHTAISRSAEKYKVAVIPDCCTTVDQMLHLIALSALSTRCELKPSSTIDFSNSEKEIF